MPLNRCKTMRSADQLERDRMLGSTSFRVGRATVRPRMIITAAAMIAVAALATPALAQTGPSSQVPADRRDSTNIQVEGQLAPTRELGCIDVADVRNVYTPPDIHTGLKHCIAEGDFDRAVRLLIVAGIFARFDAERVADVSARDAGQVLIYQTTQNMTPEQRAAYKASVDSLVKDPASMRSLCTQVMAIGRPVYLPSYMILHGAEFAARALNKLPAAEPLIPNFDASGTWTRLQSEYLHCP